MVTYQHISLDLSETYLPTIQNLSRKIWNESYSSLLSQGQIDYMLSLMYNSDRIVAEIEKGYGWYLTSVSNKYAGYFSLEYSEDHLFLHKFYLDAAYHGQGVSIQMMNFVEHTAETHQMNEIRLGVNKENKRAIRFYEKMGFEIEKEMITDIGEGFVMDDYIMIKAL